MVPQVGEGQKYQYTTPRGTYRRDSDNNGDVSKQLAAGGAFAALKRAQPHELPAYPSVGLAHPQASASAAASLANGSAKSPEIWRPDSTSAAGAAAVLARKKALPPQSWKPDPSSAAGAAAVLARDSRVAGDGVASPRQHSKEDILSPMLSRNTEPSRKNAIPRRRAVSTPQLPNSWPSPSPKPSPGASPGSSPALMAATLAHKPTMRQRQNSMNEKSTNMLPAIKPVADVEKLHEKAWSNISIEKEVQRRNHESKRDNDEKRKSDILRAATLSMSASKKTQQQHEAHGSSNDRYRHSMVAAVGAHSDAATSSSKQQRPDYSQLEEQARKVAHERLQRLYPNYNTTAGGLTGATAARSLMQNRQRTLSLDSQKSDDHRARAIESQMAFFNRKVADVDGQKRKQDSEMLMLAAQKNVQGQMKSLDNRIARETGRIPEQTRLEWQAKAKQLSETAGRERVDRHQKVDVGGGLLMDREQVDNIARGNVRPVLEEITQEAERKRARDLEAKLEMEEQARQAALEKERETDLKQEQKKLKETEKEHARAQKDVLKKQKESGKNEAHAMKVAERKEATEHKLKDEPAAVMPISRSGHDDQPSPELETIGTLPSTKYPEIPPMAESDSKQGVRKWIKNKLHKRHKSKDKDSVMAEKLFIGGAEYNRSQSGSNLVSRQESFGDVAMAGRSGQHPENPLSRSLGRHSSAESVSSEERETAVSVMENASVTSDDASWAEHERREISGSPSAGLAPLTAPKSSTESKRSGSKFVEDLS